MKIIQRHQTQESENDEDNNNSGLEVDQTAENEQDVETQRKSNDEIVNTQVDDIVEEERSFERIVQGTQKEQKPKRRILLNTRRGIKCKNQ